MSAFGVKRTFQDAAKYFPLVVRRNPSNLSVAEGVSAYYRARDAVPQQLKQGLRRLSTRPPTQYFFMGRSRPAEALGASVGAG
jgi:hypothetical protein